MLSSIYALTVGSFLAMMQDLLPPDDANVSWLVCSEIQVSPLQGQFDTIIGLPLIEQSTGNEGFGPALTLGRCAQVCPILRKRCYAGRTGGWKYS